MDLRTACHTHLSLVSKGSEVQMAESYNYLEI